MYAQFFGTFLLSHNVVTKDQLLSALGKKSSQHMKLGTLAIMKGYMTANEVDNVIISQTHNDCRFGDLAVREGYLTHIGSIVFVCSYISCMEEICKNPVKIILFFVAVI